MPSFPTAVAILSLSIAILPSSPATAQQQSAPLTLQSLPPSVTTPGAPPLCPGSRRPTPHRQAGDGAQRLSGRTNLLRQLPQRASRRSTALVLEGNASLALKQYPAAAHDFQAAIGKDPTLWAAHKNLVIAYAGQGKWPEFDQERKLLRDARASDAPRPWQSEADVIEVLYLGTDRYVVRAFPVLAGRFKARYNFAHYGKNDKLDSWLACESNDADQAAFAQKHPTEAAAGQRSFSLDGYAINSDTTTHATIKLYPDGEPTYETVRADVIGILGHKKQ